MRHKAYPRLAVCRKNEEGAIIPRYDGCREFPYRSAARTGALDEGIEYGATAFLTIGRRVIKVAVKVDQESGLARLC